MAFVRDTDLREWATPKELDAILLSRARLEAKLESHTSPVVWITLGAIGGVLYYLARRGTIASQIDNRLTQAIENAFI